MPAAGVRQFHGGFERPLQGSLKANKGFRRACKGFKRNLKGFIQADLKGLQNVKGALKKRLNVF